MNYNINDPKLKNPSFLQITVLVFLIFTISACKKSTDKNDPDNTDPDIEKLNSWIENDPDNDTLYFRRADYLLKRESYDSAIADLKTALSIDSTRKPKYYHALSEALMMNIQSKEALRVIDRAMEYFPNDLETILKSARLKLILKQHMAALATLDKLFIRDPQNADGYYLSGHIFYEMGDTGRAVNAYQKAVDINPELREGWIRLGDVLTELNNPRAISYYDNAIRMDSLDPVTWHNKADALEVLGKTNESLKLYKEICIRFPSYEPAFYNLGMLYKNMDSLTQAIDHFSISVQINPAEPSSYYQRGLCYIKSGDKLKAKQDFENALKLDDQFEEARSALNKLSR
jgi:tetratricopeptide (TPR) repeat protein